ncbi:GatB/YqeY domain-containing protein [Melioribacteraceae bacterium 4301-Me]|uniref:GatB/YqeY domain-containing protein n=1 Tax=Pyranulibacter aquaticus TaxID=3163344 RepID=UPI003597B5B4
MNLIEKINNDLKNAIKSGDKIRIETIRSIRALILEYEKSGKDKTITPEIEINLLSTAAKKRKEAIEQYKNANRNDLAEKEEKELKIIEEYLPKQLSEKELFQEIKALASQIGAHKKEDFPKLMPLAAKTLKGKADGKLIKEVVEKYLSSN